MAKNTAKPIAPSGFQPNLRVIPGQNGGGDVPEYITPQRSGLDSGVYVTDRGLPWHVTLSQRLGQDPLMVASDQKMTVAEAIALAGLDWTVAKAPTRALLYEGTERETLADVPGKFVTYREDTGAILGGNLSGSYKVIQNADAFTFGDYLLDTPGAHIETAGSLFGGRAIFVSFELPDDIHVEGDPSEYRLFLVVSNGHDGNHKLRVDVTVERVVCRNTLRIAHKRAVSSWAIRHTSGVDGRVAEARNALRLSHAYVEAFNEGAAALVGTKLVDRQVDSILADLFPLTEAQTIAVKADPSKLDRTPQGIVRGLYRDSETVAPVRGTAYGVLNAVTEYDDHFRAFRDGENGSKADNRAEALLFDPTVGERAWGLLLATAGGSKAKR